MLTFENISFRYGNDEDGSSFGFEDLNFKIEKGEYVSLVGPNGSGKTTLAMLAKGLLQPRSGRVLFDGADVTGDGINSKIGYLFSNPEDQIVSPVVENDVAFGPENQGKKTGEIASVVDSALNLCNMNELRHSLTHHLSGGEQQRLNIAGVLAMDVDLIIFDEAVAMLDAAGKVELMEVFSRLNREKGIAVLHISHCMEDMIRADRVFVLEGGEAVFDGSPLSLGEDGKLVNQLDMRSSDVFTLVGMLRQEEMIGKGPVKDVSSLADAIMDGMAGKE